MPPVGTERAVLPEMTLARARELYERAGITRVAEITRLDTVGIPVFQAIRPLSRSFCVFAGKGVTPLLAEVSAAMEALEVWQAEVADLAVQRLSLREARQRVDYDPYQLLLADPSLLNDSTELDWVPARSIVSQSPSLVPRTLFDLGLQWGDPLALPLFTISSNGLASGNTLDEALLHGLFEVVERDSTEWHSDQGFESAAELNLGTVTDPACRDLLQRFADGRVSVSVFDITGRVPIPTYLAAIASDDYPVVLRGRGCHFRPELALSRALTEAAQVRLSLIAGSRDDLAVEHAWVARMWGGGGQTLPSLKRKVTFREVAPFAESKDFANAVATAGELVADVGGAEPVMVDLTHPEVQLPVVYVCAPGLRDSR